MNGGWIFLTLAFFAIWVGWPLFSIANHLEELLKLAKGKRP